MQQDKIVQYITDIFTEHSLSYCEFHWVFLEMTKVGWKKSRLKTPKCTGIYIHFSGEGYPLRVGIALGKEGFYGRWFSSLSCHQRSFLQNRRAPLNHRRFFQQIQLYYPETYVLCLQMDDAQSRKGEQLLFTTLEPLWETRDFNGKYVWRDSKNFSQHPDITFSETEIYRG